MRARHRPADQGLRSRAVLPAALLALSLSLAACSGSDETTPDPTTGASDTSTTEPDAPEPSTTTSSPSTSEPPPTTPDGDGLALSVVGDDRQKRIVVGAAPDGDGSETLAGKLIIAEGECFSATTRDAAPTLLVFPERTTVDADRRPSVVLDGQAYPVGSPLSLRGAPLEVTAQDREAIQPCSPEGGAFLVTSVG